MLQVVRPRPSSLRVLDLLTARRQGRETRGSVGVPRTARGGMRTCIDLYLQRQRYIRSRMLAVLFALRLRRRARLRRALQDVGELSDASDDGQSVAAKRRTSE